jgi:pimeloyl-ACP methyl ester carboxylesterase
MHKFNSASVDIAFDDEGQGEPILLIHGFASNGRVNWVNTGWVKTLAAGGYRVITIDNRGHGESEKLYDPSLYEAVEMAEDARRLLDHLNIPRAHVMGYSMGARISAFLAINHPSRVAAVILAGLAENLIKGVGGGAEIAKGLEAASIVDVEDVGARAFRYFAETTGSDLKALAACIKSSRVKITEEMLAGIASPVLVVVGEKDDLSGPVEPLVRAIPGALGLTLPGRNHMNAVGDKGYKAAVSQFLHDHPLGLAKS